MKRKFIFTIALITLLNYTLKAQEFQDSVKWISFKEAKEKFEAKQKPVMVFLYSQASDSSRLMSQTTFSNPEVANYINVLFYPVRLDVNSKEQLTFLDGKKYGNSDNQHHDIAKMLLTKIDTLPALVIFDKKADGRTLLGFKNRDEIFRPLIYYAEDINENTEFEDWLKYHKKAFPPGRKQIATRLLVKWLLPKEMEEKQAVSKKKILLNFYDWRKVSCTVMRTKVFNDKRIADYINKKFYPINIDVFSKDSIVFHGTTYINEGKKHKFHQLPIAALNGLMKFPAFIILDEDYNVRDKIQRFMTVEQLKPLLEFYGDDNFKTQTWEEFIINYNLHKKE